MLGLLAPTILALAAALALGGSLRALANSHIKGWPALVIGFGVELLLYNPPVNGQPWAMALGPWIWVATRLVCLYVLVANGWPSQRLLLIAALGLGLNTLVIALNDGHMPQSQEAAMLVWGAGHIEPGRLQNVAPMGPETRLPWLADTLPEPAWLPRANVVSVGDVLLGLGIAGWAFSATQRSQSVALSIRPFRSL